MTRWYGRNGRSFIISFFILVVGTVVTNGPKAQAQDETVTVRYGIHENFNRIVFDWSDGVTYDVDHSGDMVVVAFARPASFDVLAKATDFGDLLLAAEDSDAPSTSFGFPVASNTSLRTEGFYADDGSYKVVVDVVAEPVEPEAASAAVVPTEPQTPEERYEATFDAMIANPSDPEAAINFAEAASAVGDFRGAIGALERILLVNPNLDNIKMELGVLYRRVGANELAQSYLGESLESEDVPEDVQGPAETILDETEAKVAAERTRHRVGGSFFIGGRYETNANAGPGSSNIRLFGFEGPFLDDEDTEQEDVAFLTSGNLDYAYDFGTQAGHAMEADLFGLVSRYEDETDVNTSLVDGQLGPRFFLGDPLAPAASVRPFGTASYLELDDEKYRVAYGGGLNVRSALGPVGLNVTARSVRQEFFDTDERQSASDQTGWYSTLRPSAVIEPIKGTVLGAGLVAGHNNADEDFESFIEYGANVYVSQSFLSGPYTQKPLNATLGGSYRRTEYDDPDIQVDPDTEREDDRYDVTLSLDVPIVDFLSVSLSGQQTWNESNLPNNEYDNTAGTAGFNFSF